MFLKFDKKSRESDPRFFIHHMQTQRKSPFVALQNVTLTVFVFVRALSIKNSLCLAHWRWYKLERARRSLCANFGDNWRRQFFFNLMRFSFVCRHPTSQCFLCLKSGQGPRWVRSHKRRSRNIYLACRNDDSYSKRAKRRHVTSAASQVNNLLYVTLVRCSGGSALNESKKVCGDVHR